jgi:antitoxin (DNA-binding transcriptional repressor) of toxin-antitoxin stability system
MKFVTSRDVRNNPSEFRAAVERQDVVLTVGGKPFAIAVGVEEEEVEDTLELLRRVRALRAVARMQRSAEERGVGSMSADAIDEEIGAARKARRGSA